MPLKIALLGTGNVARNNYLPYLSRQDDVSLIYHSRTRAKAEVCADEFGGQVVGSVEALLATDPDAVLVLTRETQRYDAAMALLEGHGFSGNVRELVNILQRAVTMAEGDEIQPDDLMLDQGNFCAIEPGESTGASAMPDRPDDAFIQPADIADTVFHLAH